MNLERRLEQLERALDELRQRAAGNAVLVEGRRDAEALEALGVGGEHLVLNAGASLQARIDEIAHAAETSGWTRLIVLMDWDRTGGRLQARFMEGLAGRAPLDLDIRKRIAVPARVRCVEELPSDLAAMRRDVGGRT